jgi:hypothetical protein
MHHLINYLMNKKILQPIALFSSIIIVSIYISFRSGYFNSNEKTKPITKSHSIIINDSSASELNKVYSDDVNDIKRDSPIVVSYEPPDFKFSNAEFEKLLKNSMMKNDTVEIKLSDSLFLINDTTLFINDKFVNKDIFETYLYNNLRTAYYNQRTTRLSSSKSMAVFNAGDVYVNFKNYTFNYNKIIPKNYLEDPFLFKSKLKRFWSKQKQNDFFITSKEIKSKTIYDSSIKMNEMMLSSKSGYIISKYDFKKDSVKKLSKTEIISSSKSRFVFSKNDFKKDSIANLNLDSNNKPR